MIKRNLALYLKRIFDAIRKIFIACFHSLRRSVLYYFITINRSARSKLTVWYMKKETSEHFHLMIKVLKWFVVPASLGYVCFAAIVFRQNCFGSMFWGLLLFVYSNFLPDLPSIYRATKKEKSIPFLPWYKKYMLLLLAPIFIWLFLAGIKLHWKTDETFHNFKSAVIYGVFLFGLGCFAFGDIQLSQINLVKVLALPFYGMTGYLTHLIVDKIIP